MCGGGGGGGGGRVLLCAQRLYYGRDKLDCPPPNGLNHYLPLNKTDAHRTGEGFSATLALLFYPSDETYIVCAQKNHLIETVLIGTHKMF